MKTARVRKVKKVPTKEVPKTKRTKSLLSPERKKEIIRDAIASAEALARINSLSKNVDENPILKCDCVQRGKKVIDVIADKLVQDSEELRDKQLQEAVTLAEKYQDEENAKESNQVKSLGCSSNYTFWERIKILFVGHN